MSGIRRNSIANFLGQAWTGLLAAALVPIQIHYFGVSAWGLVGVLTSLQAFITVLDVGLSTAANREMARRAAMATGGERDLLRTLEVVYAAVGLMVAAVFWVLGPPAVGFWIRDSQLPPETVSRSIQWFGVAFGARWLVFLYSGVLRGRERQVLLNVTMAAVSTVKQGGGILLLMTTPLDLPGFLRWMAVGAVLETAVLGVVTWRVLPAAEHARGRFRPSFLRAMGGFAANVTLISIMAAVLKQVDKIFIARWLPLEQTGYYATAGLAARGPAAICTSLFHSAFPRLSRYAAEGDETRLAEIYHRCSKAVAFVSAPLCAGLLFFSRDVLLLWTQSDIVASRGAMALSILAFAGLLNCLMQLPYALQLACGLTSIPLWNHGISAVLIVPLLWILVSRWGINGAAAAWAIFNVAYFAIVPLVMHRKVLRGHLSRWIIQDTLPFLALAVLLFGAGSAASVGLTDMRWRVFAAGMAAVVYAGISLLCCSPIRSFLEWRSAEDSGAAKSL